MGIHYPLSYLPIPYNIYFLGLTCPNSEWLHAECGNKKQFQTTNPGNKSWFPYLNLLAEFVVCFQPFYSFLSHTRRKMATWPRLIFRRNKTQESSVPSGVGTLKLQRTSPASAKRLEDYSKS